LLFFLQIIGVILAAVASIISNFGVNLQKLSHQKEGQFNEDRNYWTDRTWVIGLVMVILGSVFDFLALGFAAQSIVRFCFACRDPLKHEVSSLDSLVSFILLFVSSLSFALDMPLKPFVCLCLFSQVAPLGSLTLVANVFFAPLMLGETLDRRDWVGTAAIVVGSAVAVGFATHDEAPITYACCLLSVIAALIQLS
jgi:drug/metabolite transporter (DMT)-like permease